jgi:hypothetical protein
MDTHWEKRPDETRGAISQAKESRKLKPETGDRKAEDGWRVFNIDPAAVLARNLAMEQDVLIKPCHRQDFFYDFTRARMTNPEFFNPTTAFAKRRDSLHPARIH